MCGIGEDVLTKTAAVKEGRKFLKDIECVAESDTGQDLLNTLKSLHLQFGVQVDAHGRSATREEIDRDQRAA